MLPYLPTALQVLMHVTADCQDMCDVVALLNQLMLRFKTALQDLLKEVMIMQHISSCLQCLFGCCWHRHIMWMCCAVGKPNNAKALCCWCAHTQHCCDAVMYCCMALMWMLYSMLCWLELWSALRTQPVILLYKKKVQHSKQCSCCMRHAHTPNFAVCRLCRCACREYTACWPLTGTGVAEPPNLPQLLHLSQVRVNACLVKPSCYTQDLQLFVNARCFTEMKHRCLHACLMCVML